MLSHLAATARPTWKVFSFRLMSHIYSVGGLGGLSRISFRAAAAESSYRAVFAPVVIRFRRKLNEYIMQLIKLFAA